MKKYCFLVAVMFFVSVFTACGMLDISRGGASSLDDLGQSESFSNEMKASVDSYDGDYSYGREDYSTDYKSEAEAVKDNRMIAREARLSVDVGDLETFDKNIKSAVNELGGYFTNATVDNYDNEWSSDRYAYYTFKVPADRLDDFLNELDGEASVMERTVTAEDISLQYVDNNARLESLKTEKENLLRLMDETKAVSDIIEIEDRLSEVQYQLDSAEQQKLFMEGRVSYSEVNLTAHEERNVAHPVRKIFEVNFGEKFVDGMSAAVVVFTTILFAIPAIIIIMAFVLLFIWILRHAWIRIFKKKNGIRYALMPVRIEDMDASTGDTVQKKDVIAEETIVIEEEPAVQEAEQGDDVRRILR